LEGSIFNTSEAGNAIAKLRSVKEKMQELINDVSAAQGELRKAVGDDYYKELIGKIENETTK